ncbi:hypothetical protein KC331_g7778 [Hortaea werneckii]|uniref:DUF676 domain-containing protein n=1 Tax=Hortaea werneckii TaxID=91943 RepID=A0A3M7BW06_HORWE|nr:hypothetical protein KC331_g7778 [Hortaea werneckii]RMY43894.1 hypothetical protein D0865_10927 [Hortaea werneckii]
MTKTLLLVFIHGFKGSDHTFHTFPQDLRAYLSHSLPEIDILSIQYPQYETRGELRECVARFKDWLQNKVIDLEVANQTPSPTVDPSVHVVLCGHSMGGIVAAETLLSIARDEPVPMGQANETSNSTSTTQEKNGAEQTESAVEDEDTDDKKATQASTPETTRLLFPCVKAILAFDTPYLGISPGVLAHGAEEHFNQASAAYKAFDSASNFFGWKSPRNATPEPIPGASSKGLPAADNSTASGWSKWGTYAKYGGAAAALAGAAGAAYINRNQISQGFAWAGSHLEFVGCLGRGAELQKRVENVVELTRTHDIGFANFYGALSEKASSKTQYAGAMVGQDRTFCVIPKAKRTNDSPTGSKRAAPPEGQNPAPKRRKTQTEEDMRQEMDQGEKVAEFAEDPSKSKGHWVKCVNPSANDEIRAHTSMFQPQKNPDYHDMIGRARDQITGWIDQSWYRGARNNEGREGVDNSNEAMA